VGQLHNLVALSPGNETPVPIGHTPGYAPQRMWMLSNRKISVLKEGTQLPCCSATDQLNYSSYSIAVSKEQGRNNSGPQNWSSHLEKAEDI